MFVGRALTAHRPGHGLRRPRTGGDISLGRLFARRRDGWLVAALVLGILLVLSLSALPGAKGILPDRSRISFAAYPALKVNILPNNTVLDIGMSVTLIANVSGGSGVAANWAYTWAGLPAGCAATTANNTTCAPGSSGSWNVTVTVHDSVSHQRTTSARALVVVNGDPQVVQFTNSAGARVTAGYNFTLSVLVSNGTAPYVYSYKGLFSTCTGTSTPTVICKAGAAGLYTFNVTVTDSVGATNTSSINLTVTAAPATYIPPTTPVHTTSHSALGATTYAEITAILVVGALLAAALLVKARRDERQTFRAVPTEGSVATTPAPSPASAAGPIEPQPAIDETKSGGKVE